MGCSKMPFALQVREEIMAQVNDRMPKHLPGMAKQGFLETMMPVAIAEFLDEISRMGRINENTAATP